MATDWFRSNIAMIVLVVSCVIVVAVGMLYYRSEKMVERVRNERNE